MCLSKKLFNFLKVAKGIRIARECDWIGKVLKTFEIWGFFKRRKVFSEKNFDGFKNG